MAGFETAYSILFASVYNLAKHPQIQELFYNKLQEKLVEHVNTLSTIKKALKITLTFLTLFREESFQWL